MLKRTTPGPAAARVPWIAFIAWDWEGAAVRELQRPIRRMGRIVGHFRILSCMLCSTCLCYE